MVKYASKEGVKEMEHQNQTPVNGENTPQETPGKSKAIASLVLGIVALVICWSKWGAIASIVAAIVGIVLAVQAKKEMPAGTSGMATAGMVLCIITLALGAFVIAACTLCATCTAGVFGGLLGNEEITDEMKNLLGSEAFRNGLNDLITKFLSATPAP